MTTQAGASLNLEGLSCRYGSELAVDDISLDVRSGEFVSFLGPSGSGKTTTLNMIAGFVDPSAGQITLDGSPISGLPSYKRNLGVVFQHYALFPHMTVEQNVAYPLKRRGLSRGEIRTRVQEALESVRLTKLARRRPAQLSGGQQQRVAVARAVVFKPRLLLMDEPLGALDKKLREELQIEIRRLHRELEITFVYVTHDQDEALALSDRIAVFHNGRIEQVGTAEELYERPISRFVGEFIGESNLFGGIYNDDSATPTVTIGENQLPVSRHASATNGQGVLVLVRPEHVVISPLGQALGPAMSATIREAVYLGSSRRLGMQSKSGDTIWARTAASTTNWLNEGDTVDVTWSAEHMVVLNDDVDTANLRERELDPAPAR